MRGRNERSKEETRGEKTRGEETREEKKRSGEETRGEETRSPRARGLIQRRRSGDLDVGLVWLSLFVLSGLVAVVYSSLYHCFIWSKVVCCSESVGIVSLRLS